MIYSVLIILGLLYFGISIAFVVFMVWDDWGKNPYSGRTRKEIEESNKLKTESNGGEKS